MTKTTSTTKNVIALDNGVTGTVAVLYANGTSAFLPTPVIRVRDYTKDVQHCHRVDWKNLLNNIPKDSVAVIERPMVDPKRWSATKSALRSLEATLIVLEMLDIPYEIEDSKSWQKEFLSSSCLGAEEMKKASKEVSKRLFPQHSSKIDKHGDGDSLLLALYYKQKRGL